MLWMKTYHEEYMDWWRGRVAADVRAYREQVGAAWSPEFETRFFCDQVLLLDYMFVHRLAGSEGKDGNPLNEVRALCNSILLNQGKLQLDKLPGWPNSAGPSIKLPAGKSVLKLKPGDEVKLTVSDFVRLFTA